MSKSLKAIIREGKIEQLEEVNLPEGSKVLVTLLADDEAEFWFQASRPQSIQFGITLRMMFMPNFSKNYIVLVRYPYSDLSGAKVKKSLPSPGANSPAAIPVA
jgi:hypothetical protein